jgi:hypothetical protein
METSTLDRKKGEGPGQASGAYPLYHTCTRKKRVTIVEHGKEESEV